MVQTNINDKRLPRRGSQRALISVRCPPLKSGLTLANFKASGKTPFSMDFFQTDI